MPVPNTVHAEVAAELAKRPVSFAPPLKIAWTWNRSGKSEDLQKAEQLLALLAAPDEFGYVLPVRYEQAFNLVRQKRPAEALDLLRKIRDDFRHALDEDTLSLEARIYKDRGDAALAADDLVGAERWYSEAVRWYERAYLLRADRFPGINLATLLLVRAGLVRAIAERAFGDGAETAALDRETAGRAEAAELRRQARAMAAQLVAARDTWTDKLPDDAIWRLATLAEAYLLLGEWDEARNTYRAALDPANSPKPYHAESMRAQLRRVLAAHERLGAPARDPNDFIPPAA